MKGFSRRPAVVAGAVLVVLVAAAVGVLQRSSVLRLDNAFVTGRVIHLAAPTTGIVETVELARFGTLVEGRTAFLIGEQAAAARVRTAAMMVAAAFSESGQACMRLHSHAETVQLNSRAVQIADDRMADTMKLSEQGFISRRQVELQRFEHDKALGALRADAFEHRRLQMEGSGAVPGSGRIVEAIELLRQALTEQRRTRVRVGSDVFVQDVQVLPGQWVKEGAELATVLPLEATRIQANVLESQIGRVAIGQAALVRLDGLDDHAVLHGHVEVVVPATAATFSQLQRNTADSTWMKVAQRIPVVVRVDDRLPAGSVHVGQSATVELLPGQAAWASSTTRPSSPPRTDDDVEGELRDRLEHERGLVAARLRIPAGCVLFRADAG